MLSLAEPLLGEQERKAVIDTLDSGWITMGERVLQFESKFAQMHGHETAIAVNSCTSGLHLALAALGIKPGDQVLVPSLTFVATINAIKYVGATPVFVDIESLSVPHISLAHARELVNDKVKAVIVMHYGGYVVDMKQWRDLADQNDLWLIEDAAHSPGCSNVGMVGDITSFSFFSNKNMTTAEGGMLLANDSKILDRLRLLRSHGMTSLTLDRHRGHAYSYDVLELGYNYRLDEIRAAIGLVQLEKLKEWNTLRIQKSNLYRQQLQANRVGIELLFDSTHVSAAHLMCVLLPKNTPRNSVMDNLRENGVQTSIHYPPAHKFTYYQKEYPGISLTLTEEFCSRELTLPLHPALDNDAISYISEKLINACAEN